jgi:ubiquinone/menaquinone biosynthesis C-methylase UbiE
LYLANTPGEPNAIEIGVTLGFGLTVLSPYYQSFVESIGLTGHEKVLDFGSGSGLCARYIARRLQRRGGHLDCVDVSQRWMEALQKNLRRSDNVSFHLGELDNLALVEQSYDVIISHFSLHEISRERLPGTLYAFSRLLNNRGRVIFREPLDAMIEGEQIKLMAKSSGLRVTSINESKLLIGQVIEGVLKLNFCGL